MTEYRIVRDGYLGFEVQSRRWWWPFWVQCSDGGPTNTWRSVDKARTFAERKAGGGVVEYLGRLPRDSGSGAQRENGRSPVEAEGPQSGGSEASASPNPSQPSPPSSPENPT